MNRLLSVLAMVAGATFAWGDVKPSSLFSDHMVLQSGMQVPVWGTASPGERVTVKLNEQEQSSPASSDGKWLVRLPNLKPGGPYEMLITGQNTITITDVLIGEVWLGSGQSNMAFTVSKARAYYAGVLAPARLASGLPHVLNYLDAIHTGHARDRYEREEDLALGVGPDARKRVVDGPAFSARFLHDVEVPH